MLDLSVLEKRLNLKIKDKTLFELALTHPSYNGDVNSKHQDYERLEYIGDAVLGFVSADLIFKNHPKMDQGIMSKLRSNIVKSHSLAEYARSFNLAQFIRVGHSVPINKINESDKILEDIFEALIGAIYLDAGIQKAYQHISSFILDDIVNFDLEQLTDYKSRLQEAIQAEHREAVNYVTVETSGPAHDRTFKVHVLFSDIVLGVGVGKSKRAAEEEAAKDALSKRSTF